MRTSTAITLRDDFLTAARRAVSDDISTSIQDFAYLALEPQWIVRLNESARLQKRLGGWPFEFDDDGAEGVELHFRDTRILLEIAAAESECTRPDADANYVQALEELVSMLAGLEEVGQ